MAIDLLIDQLQYRQHILVHKLSTGTKYTQIKMKEICTILNTLLIADEQVLLSD